MLHKLSWIEQFFPITVFALLPSKFRYTLYAVRLLKDKHQKAQGALRIAFFARRWSIPNNG